MNDGTIEDAFEAVQQFEFAHDGVVVVETLSHHWGQSSLQLLYFASKHQEVLVELLLVDVHGVVGEGSEVLHCFFELLWDLFDGVCESFALGSSELDPFEFIELHDGGGEMEYIVTAFAVGVKSWEEGVESEFPLAFWLVFILEVVFFEFGADIDSGLEFATDFCDVFWAWAEGAGYHTSIDVFTGASDDLVAGLFDQNDKARRRVVEFAELVYLQEGVHDGREQLGESGELSSVIT